jgi:hypothetical protein
MAWKVKSQLTAQATSDLLGFPFVLSSNGADRAWRLKEASSKAQLYWWVLAGLAVTATTVAPTLIPPFKSETLPTGLKGISRFVLTVVLVAGSIVVVVYGSRRRDTT